MRLVPLPSINLDLVEHATAVRLACQALMVIGVAGLTLRYRRVAERWMRRFRRWRAMARRGVHANQ